MASNPSLAARFPLAILSPPARNALNSTFANLPVFLDTEKTPRLDMHPSDAAARAIADGDKVRVFNDRGSLVLTARVSDRTREGVVVAISIWWRKLSPDSTNANMVTGQALTDMGRAATFYDTLVEVQKMAGTRHDERVDCGTAAVTGQSSSSWVRAKTFALNTPSSLRPY